MIEKVFAAVVLVACLVGLLRMALQPRQQQRLDGALRGAWQRLRSIGKPRPPRAPTADDAARAAQEAIRRARDGHWEGNVYKPRSFRRPKKQGTEPPRH